MTYTYDQMGTLTTVDKSGGSTGDQCFAYDQFGLLAAFKKDATTGCGQGTGDVTYAYDALGRTVSRTGSATTTNSYVLTGEDLARTTTSGTSTLYLFSPEGLLASSTAGQARFFLKDLHGDTVGAVNASGSIVASKLYSPWGESAASAGESLLPGFQSQPTDADTGYVDMMTRLYAPTQGRFSSRDVLFGDTQSPASMNQYGYSEGSPVSAWDITGLSDVGTWSGNNLGYGHNWTWPYTPADKATIHEVAHITLGKDGPMSVRWRMGAEWTGCSPSGACVLGPISFRFEWGCQHHVGILWLTTCGKGDQWTAQTDMNSGVLYYRPDPYKTTLTKGGDYRFTFVLTAADDATSGRKNTGWQTTKNFNCSDNYCKPK